VTTTCTDVGKFAKSREGKCLMMDQQQPAANTETGAHRASARTARKRESLIKISRMAQKKTACFASGPGELGKRPFP
jgi:hypothetical protein